MTTDSLQTDSLQKCYDAITQATIPFKDSIDFEINCNGVMKDGANGDDWQHVSLTRETNISIKITAKKTAANTIGIEAVKGELATVWEECRFANWDGHGAIPIAQDTYNTACRFLEALPLSTLPPSIGAEPDGAMTLEWHRTKRHTLSVSVEESGELNYAALLGLNRQFGMEAFTGEIPDRILRLIDEVCRT